MQILSNGVATFLLPAGNAGYIGFVAYIKQGNVTTYSNILELLIYPPADESGGARIQVLDRARRSAIYNARVDLREVLSGGSTQPIFTNQNGYCAIRQLNPGEYDLFVSASQYTSSQDDDYSDNDSIIIT